jgi:hypothetical protein
MIRMERRLASETETAAFGAALGAVLRAGDVVCISGPLGAGKTTLARGAIAARTGESEAPSPTYALVETYDGADGLAIWHFDLYRLAAPEDVYELGVEDAFAEGASIIEWPEKIESLIPADALLLRLAHDGAERRLSLAAAPAWADRLQSLAAFAESPESRPMTPPDPRAAERAAFLAAAGWANAHAAPLAGDASTRSYDRLTKSGRVALLMNAPPAAEGAACPPEADADERRRLGYNAMARLAGPNLNAFTAIAAALRAAGIAAPEVYAADPARGFALIEDFGDDLFARAIARGADPAPLYEAAVDALLQLARARIAAPAGPAYRMLAYDRVALEAEIGLLIDWYWEMKTGSAPDATTRRAYAQAWSGVLDLVSPPQTLVLRDYHAENLIWRPEQAGVARVGVIDFQDGLVGSRAYDLVSLLEDARRDVAPELAANMRARYEAAAAADPAFDPRAFARDYAVLAAQRNAKILGIFARLVRRDGKPRYRDFLPRVEGYFRRDLARRELAPVRAFFAGRIRDLAP